MNTVSPGEVLSFAAMALGMVGMIFGPTVLVCLWEKRLVWPYVPLEAPPAPVSPALEESDNPYAVGRAVEVMGNLAPTDYAVRAVEGAKALGFRPLDVLRDGKGRIYKIRYDFWLSPGREVLAIIGGGILGVIPVRNTWLITPLSDGRRLVTLDNQSASELDLAGLTDEALIVSVDFRGLLEGHSKRLAASPVPPVPYPETGPLEDHRAFRTRRFDRLEELGYAKFLDERRNVWRYTLKGAIAFSVRAILKGIRRVVWPDSRLVPSRPGDRQHVR